MVNSDDTIIENIWAWRGDHGNGIGWTQNTGDTGVVVNGDDVTAYGLFVEHYQKYQTIWNGETRPDDLLPERAAVRPAEPGAWTSPTGNGWASYKVAPSVKCARGLGPGRLLLLQPGRRHPRRRGASRSRTGPGVRFHNMITVFLDGSGGIERTINEAGTPVVGSYGTSALTEYPE